MAWYDDKQKMTHIAHYKDAETALIAPDEAAWYERVKPLTAHWLDVSLEAEIKRFDTLLSELDEQRNRVRQMETQIWSGVRYSPAS